MDIKTGDLVKLDPSYDLNKGKDFGLAADKSYIVEGIKGALCVINGSRFLRRRFIVRPWKFNVGDKVTSVYSGDTVISARRWLTYGITKDIHSEQYELNGVFTHVSHIRFVDTEYKYHAVCDGIGEHSGKVLYIKKATDGLGYSCLTNRDVCTSPGKEHELSREAALKVVEAVEAKMRSDPLGNYFITNPRIKLTPESKERKYPMKPLSEAIKDAMVHQDEVIAKYMILGKAMPTVIHTSYHTAYIEALRLSEADPEQEFKVIKICKTFKPKPYVLKGEVKTIEEAMRLTDQSAWIVEKFSHIKTIKHITITDVKFDRGFFLIYYLNEFGDKRYFCAGDLNIGKHHNSHYLFANEVDAKAYYDAK
jgi:hypothetical protein